MMSSSDEDQNKEDKDKQKKIPLIGGGTIPPKGAQGGINRYNSEADKQYDEQLIDDTED